MSCRIGRPEAWGGCQMATGLCQGLRRLPWLLRSATAPGPRLSAPGGRPRREQAKVLAGQEPSNPEGGRSPAIPPFRRVNTHSHGGRASGRGRALRAPEGNRNPEPGTRSRTEGHTSENAMRDVRNRQTECQTEARTGQGHAREGGGGMTASGTPDLRGEARRRRGGEGDKARESDT